MDWSQLAHWRALLQSIQIFDLQSYPKTNRMHGPKVPAGEAARRVYAHSRQIEQRSKSAGPRSWGALGETSNEPIPCS